MCYSKGHNNLSIKYALYLSKIFDFRALENHKVFFVEQIKDLRMLENYIIISDILRTDNNCSIIFIREYRTYSSQPFPLSSCLKLLASAAFLPFPYKDGTFAFSRFQEIL